MKRTDLLQDIENTKATAELLFTPADVDNAVDRMAIEITDRLRDTNPVLIGMMTGGIVPLSLLLPRLSFPLQVDYVHASRYGENTHGGQTQWIKRPTAKLSGRTVLLIDDLLDRGVTLEMAVDECLHIGASAVLTAVLLTKTVDRRPGLVAADFSGLTGPDRYLFGYGMDYKTYWRNGAGIFAVAQ